VKLVVIVVRKLELELSPDKAPLYPTLASLKLYLMQIRVFACAIHINNKLPRTTTQ